jgi:hypothetical protein
MTRDTIAPPEDHEQITLFAWIDLHVNRFPELRLAFHVPNGGHRNPHVGAHMKRMGVRAGVPDILLPVARAGYTGLAIELKRSIGGRVSPEQQKWLSRLEEQGWQTYVCYGADEAIRVISTYMQMETS